MAITEKYVSDAGAGAHDGSTAADAFSWAEMVTDINAGGKAGNRYNVIKGAGAIARTTTTDTISGSGSSTSPVIIRGYNSTIGDGYLGRTNGNGPLITTNMPAITYTSGRINVTGAWIVIESLSISGATNNSLLSINQDSLVIRCAASNNNTGGSAGCLAFNANGGTVLDSDLALTAASGGIAAIQIGSLQCRVAGCRVTGGPASGITVAGAAAIVGNVIHDCAGTAGIYVSGTGGSPAIVNNTIVGCVDGIEVITGNTRTSLIFGNLITDNSAYGINGVSSANAIIAAYNRLDRNTTANVNSATDWLAATSYSHNTTSALQAAEYVDASTDDYRLGTSPSLGAGHFAYADIGALQKQSSGAPQLTGGAFSGGISQ